MISDIDALNIHIAALAKTLGLVASARLVESKPSGSSSGSPSVEVTVTDMRKNPPLECSKSVTPEDYQDVGIHTFDEFILLEAARELKRR
jgi:hypothetical protein